MKLIKTPILFASLLTLSVAGCHDEPHPDDLSELSDMAVTDDLRMSPKDLSGPPRDMVTPPADMRMPPADMRMPPADMTMPPADMTMPSGDMAVPGDGMGPPTDDLGPPTADLGPPTDDMMTPTDDMMTPATDMATTPTAPTEFIVVRVGDGAAALTGAAAAGFLERHKISDGSLVGTAMALPTAVSGSNRRLTLGGNVASEGSLTRSVDGRYLVIGGYDADVGTASVSSSASGTVNRVIGRLDSVGGFDSSTAGDFFSGNNLRSVTSTDGSALWASSSSGIAYTTFGSMAKPTSLLSANIRWAQIFSGQLYASSGSTSYHGINQVGTGTPITTTTATLLSGFAAQPMSSHYGFIALDRDGMAGIDVIYVADDRAVASGGGVERWTLSGATWNLDGTLKKGLTAGARGLTGFVSGSSVVLLATTAEPAARVVSFVDDGTALDMIAATPLATAATNTAYRGIALPPQ